MARDDLTPPAQGGGRFPALRHPDFGRYVLGQSVSLVGFWMQLVAQGWLVYRLSGSELALGAVSFAGYSPVLLFAPIAGVVADRVDKWRLIVCTQSAAMVLALALGVLAALDLVTVPLVAALACALGTVGAFDLPTRDVHGDGAGRQPGPGRDRRAAGSACGAGALGGRPADRVGVSGATARARGIDLTRPLAERADMATFMRDYEHQTYALLRIVAGFLLLWHGLQKLFGFPGEGPPAPDFVRFVAGPIELIAGLFVMIGFATRWAAFLCSGLMAAAYWMAHGTQHPLPIVNRGELAALYCFVFLFIAARGPGIWSVEGRAKG